jgi:hypothetical protein
MELRELHITKETLGCLPWELDHYISFHDDEEDGEKLLFQLAEEPYQPGLAFGADESCCTWMHQCTYRVLVLCANCGVHRDFVLFFDISTCRTSQRLGLSFDDDLPGANRLGSVQSDLERGTISRNTFR